MLKKKKKEQAHVPESAFNQGLGETVQVTGHNIILYFMQNYKNYH